jgi:hypothetical protein
MINISKITKRQAQFWFKLNIMNPSFSSLSLAQIVNNNHQAASVFEKYHLDFAVKENVHLNKLVPSNNFLYPG